MLLNSLLKAKVEGCLQLGSAIEVSMAIKEEMEVLEDVCGLHQYWEERLKLCFELMFSAIKSGGASSTEASEAILLPCMQIINSYVSGSHGTAKCNSSRFHETSDEHVPLVSYKEWSNSTSSQGRAAFDTFERRRQVLSKSAKVNDYNTLALKYSLKWRYHRGARSLSAALARPSWISGLLLSRSSAALRSEAVLLLERLLDGKSSTHRTLPILDLISSLLPEAAIIGEDAQEMFELYNRLIDDPTMRRYMAVRGHLASLVALIGEEASKINQQEHSFTANISQGYVLKKLVEILVNCLEIPGIRRYSVRHELLKGVMKAYFIIGNLVVQKNKILGDCGVLIRTALQNIQSDGEFFQEEYIKAGVALLKDFSFSNSLQALVLENLAELICPVEPEPDYQLVLQKSQTQEEFIRGNLTRNPYSSSEIGSTMRDVKNKICRELELHGLIDDDLGMELLVAGHIISLDLPVRLVYEQFWRKALTRVNPEGAITSPMHVTYRLQGLDGEATEPVIDSLQDNDNEAVDPEIEFRIASVMACSGGLVELMRLLDSLSGQHITKEEHLLRLLLHCTKLQCNRRALLEQGALPQILAKATTALSSEALVSSAEALLLILEAVVLEAVSSQQEQGAEKGQYVMSLAGVEAEGLVELFLSKLADPAAKLSTRNSEALARLLPFVSFGDDAAMQRLVNYFDSNMDLDEVDRAETKNTNTECKAHLESLVYVVDNISLDERGHKLRSLFLEKELPGKACSYLKSVFSDPDGSLIPRSSETWSEALGFAGVFYALRILKALAHHHHSTQKVMFITGSLPLLHALECSTSEKGIGALAEELLNVLGECDEGGILQNEVQEMRDATKTDAKRRAAAQREQMLREMGLERVTVSSGEVKIVAAADALKSIAASEGLDGEDEEEEKLSCVICGEGYRLNPREPLGVYCYCMRVRDLGGSSGKLESTYSSVSHFTPIHFQCHRAAKRADASLKTPKKEWEGAAIRNNETLCNNLLPLNSSALPQIEYAQCAQLWWDNVLSLGHIEKPRHELLFHDVKQLFSVFATEGSFSVHSHGGGKESNAHLVPGHQQMGQCSQRANAEHCAC